MPDISTDIKENDILRRWPEVLQTLLIDHTTHRNIIWATDMYVAKFGEAYSFSNEIKVEQITGDFGEVIKPRAVKPKEEQEFRVKDKAEVFTPSWICNAQNNLVDEAWFGRKDVFNTVVTTDDGSQKWEPTADSISFPEGKTWKDYVRDTRLEISMIPSMGCENNNYTWIVSECEKRHKSYDFDGVIYVLVEYRGILSHATKQSKDYMLNDIELRPLAFITNIICRFLCGRIQIYSVKFE